MSYKIIVSPIAVKNLDDAVEYYVSNVSKKVAFDFLKDFKKTYKNLQINPFYQIHDNNYRFLPFDKFPFVAFFIVDEISETVFLNAVFHTSQNPIKYPIR
ncbi:type II toxin-antitoxin system RelE/ParE family toxin [Flavobacterium sp.]|jgi:toxin ParE1/3/4|uniref:type II toxin-antitoxin system RelE/ParE family toxin n=1 Tax=Flavobacterium sp. TaxID=239 RepID=UPI0037C111D4